MKLVEVLFIFLSFLLGVFGVVRNIVFSFFFLVVLRNFFVWFIGRLIMRILLVLLVLVFLRNFLMFVLKIGL